MQLNFNLNNNTPVNLINFDNKSKELDFLPDDCIITDIETTGLNPLYDLIIEISALKIINNKIEDEFSRLIKINKPIPYFITKLTGIDDSMLQFEDEQNKVLFDYCEFAGYLPVCGHNVKFDLSFINSALKKEFSLPLKNDFADTILFAKKAYPNLNSYKLTNLANYLKFDTTNAHRALFDCHMTYKLFLDIKSKI